MLEIRDISFSYTELPVIKNVSFTVNQGKHVSIIGESGCGKSTLLKLIYGLHDLDSGSIFFNDNPILGPKYNLVPGADFIKYLAQDFGLMPFTTVAENVGSYLSNIYSAQKQERVSELLEIVEMTEFAHVKTRHLSGGQQQRVALAKVLALEPKVLLLDEPFSQLDAFRTNSLRRKIFQYLKKNNITCIIASHDPNDVLAFSDETIVLRNGTIVRHQTPHEVYNDPQSKYVASLFGDVNEIPENYLKVAGDKNKLILVYPQQLKAIEQSLLAVTVQQSYYKGSHYLIEAQGEFGIIYFEHATVMQKNMLTYLQYQILM